MSISISPTWQRFFAQPAAPAPTHQPPVPPSLAARPLFGSSPTRRQAGTEAGATRAGAAPPARPRLPVDRRSTPPEPPRSRRELIWLTWQMPARMQEQAIEALRCTLDWRTQYCKPLDEPKTPAEYTRFGLLGEQLVPQGGVTVRKTLRAELRETVRVVEGVQPRLERNRLLAMHSTRLGQLCADLEQRGLDTLEEVRSGLAVLWD